jgi:Ca2+-binding RTX toxin-like protein
MAHMLPILLFSAASTLAIGSLFDLFDGSSPEQDIEDAELEEQTSLLDDTAIVSLEDAFADDPLLAQEDYLDEDEQLAIYDDTDWTSNEGTDGDDFIAIPDGFEESEADAVFGNGGDDVLLGSNTQEAYDVLFGDDGDDTIFGRGGLDQIFGNDGNDILSGGDDGDLIVGGEGSDTIYGGAGDDNIFDGDYIAGSDGETTDVIIAGDGDDGVIIEDGVNLVSLGEGADHLQVFSDNDENAGAVVTDFDPEEDALLLGVYAEGLELPDGVNAYELEYTLTEIETSLGTGTLIAPIVTDETLAASLGDTSTAYAVLLDVTPEDLEGADIQVVLESDETVSFDAGSVFSTANDMGATRI